MTNTRIPAVPGHTGALSQNRGYPYYALFSGTAAALGTSANIASLTSDLRFATTSTGGETIKISGSKDNVNFTDLLPINEATGLPVTSVNLATGSYRIPMLKAGQWRHFKFTKSAAVQTGSAVIAAVLPRPAGAPYL